MQAVIKNSTHQRKWVILVVLFLATAINYLIRQSIGCTIVPITEEFSLDNVERGNILSAFILTYAITHLFIGFLIDRLRNIKAFFALTVAGMALCTILIGQAEGYHSMLTLCYVLGIFGAANFPICLMIVARIFPVQERAFATGVFGSGAFIATLAAPKFVIMLSNEWSWRYAFSIVGLLGFLWIILWFLICPTRLCQSHLAEKSENQPRTESWISSLRQIIGRPSFWGVAAIGIGIVPCLYFTTQWLPLYFTYGLDHAYNQDLGNKLTIIYLFQDLGMWSSGVVVFLLARYGFSVLKVQKAIAVTGGFMMMCVLFLLTPVNNWECVMIFAVFTFGLGLSLSNQQTFKQYVLPGQVASVAALVGFIETLFSSLFIRHIGNTVGASDNYTAVIILLAACSAFAIIATIVSVRRKWMVIK